MHINPIKATNPKYTQATKNVGLSTLGVASLGIVSAISNSHAEKNEKKSPINVFAEEVLNLKQKTIVKNTKFNEDMLNRVLNDATAKMCYNVYEEKLFQYHGMKPTGVYENSKTGFKAVTYSDNSEIIICYVGTDGKKDFFSDFQMMIGKVPEQYKDAEELYQKIKRENPDKDIMLTGHSLGGSLAQLVASKNKDVAAITYNAFGVERIVKNNKNKYGFNENNNCYNYIVDGDFVSNCSRHMGKTVSNDNIIDDKHLMHNYVDRWV